MAKRKKQLRTNAMQAQAQFAEGVAKPNYVESLFTEIASRRIDPYEYKFMGILQSTDPLVKEKGKAAQDLYDDLMRDGKVYSSMEKRIMTQIARPWQVTPVTDSPLAQEHASIITDKLKRVKFNQVCRGLMDALLVGMSVAEIVWTHRDGFIVPERIIKRSTKRFLYKEVDERTSPELRLITRQNMQDGVSLPDHKFIVHRTGVYDDNPYGQGVGLQLFWAVFFKRCSMVSWNKLNDRFGTPTAWGKYAPGASKKQQSTLLNALRSISSDGVVITPDDASIALIEAAMGGSVNSHKELCNYLDNWIDAVLNGQNRSENSGGAQAASSNERRDTLIDLSQGDTELMCDTLNDTLLPWICDFNGFEQCQVSRPIQEEEDQRATAETYGMVYTLGFKPSLSMVKEKFGDAWEERDMSQQGGYNSFATPYNTPYTNPYAASPASFAEARLPKGAGKDDADAIDEAVESMQLDDFNKIMQDIIAPYLEKVDKAASFEEALAALQGELPDMNTNELEAALAKMMFGAQAVGRSGLITPDDAMRGNG